MIKTCSLPNCSRKHYAKGLCALHWKKAWYHKPENKEKVLKYAALRLASPEGKAVRRARASKPSNRFRIMKRNARLRNHEFDLTLDYYIKLIAPNKCHYCPRPLNNEGCGLDRMDSSKGYLVDNVVPCCGECNTLKMDILSYEEMVIISKVLWDYRKSKNDRNNDK